MAFQLPDGALRNQIIWFVKSTAMPMVVPPDTVPSVTPLALPLMLIVPP